MNLKKTILAAALLAGLAPAEAYAQEPQLRPPFGDNVISISPLQITHEGLGLGLHYEHVLDKDGIIALTVPFVVSFNNDYNYHYYGMTKRRHTAFHFMPGIKFYPTGNRKKVS